MLFCCHKSIFRVSRVVFEGKLRLKRLLIAFFFFDISLISQFSPHLIIFKIRLQIILHYKKGEKHTCDLPYWENDWSLVLGTQARHCEQWYSVLFWPRGIYKSVIEFFFFINISKRLITVRYSSQMLTTFNWARSLKTHG